MLIRYYLRLYNVDRFLNLYDSKLWLVGGFLEPYLIVV